MNASGIIEEETTPLNRTSSNVTSISNGGPSTIQNISDRYTRLAESRSITPSPPPSTMPPTSLTIKQHIPSLSPISSSAESSPVNEAAQQDVDEGPSGSNIMSPTAKAKSIIASKFSMLSSVLQVKNFSKKAMLNRK